MSSPGIAAGVYVIESAKTKRYLYQDGEPIKGDRGDEHGWGPSSGFQAPSVLGSVANDSDRTKWKILPLGGEKYFIENIHTRRYLFQTGERIKPPRGSEGGWSPYSGFQAPSVLGTDANYYDRAYWKIRSLDGGKYIFENVQTERYLFLPEASSGSQTPVALGTDENYYGLALMKLVKQQQPGATHIHVTGRMETAAKPGLYVTVKDYSNPSPYGGLELDTAKPDNQHYAFVSAPDFPQGQMMLVTYPRIDYKLRMSDRESTSSGTGNRRIIETIKTTPGEIAEGKSIPTPSNDFLWKVEKQGESIFMVVVSVHDGRAIDIHVPPSEVKAGDEVSGYPKHGRTDQQWNFENPL